jgi:hypothetical protein
MKTVSMELLNKLYLNRNEMSNHDRYKIEDIMYKVYINCPLVEQDLKWIEEKINGKSDKFQN